jgi:hypothetical protein
MDWATLKTIWALPVVIAMLCGCQSSKEVEMNSRPNGQDISRLSVEKLVQMMESSNGVDRAAASAELFRRGRKVLTDLQAAGAKIIGTLNPPRLDVVYSLIQGLPPGQYRTDSFGLHLEPNTSRKDIIRMGEKYGFVLPHEEPFHTDHVPNCYVRLKPGKQLGAVLRDLLSNEPLVITINLNYYEN